MKYGKERVSLYRDDGLILLSGTSARLADKARKDLHELFEEFHLKITAEITHQSVNFLDVTFNLRDESYQPYRKPGNDPLFIDSRSNHPPAITKQLPTSVNMRISQLSSNQEAFSKTAPLYEAALRRSNYQADLKYSPNNSNKTRTRSLCESQNLVRKPRQTKFHRAIQIHLAIKEKRRFSIEWTILKQTPSYRSGAKNCNLCLQGKCIS
jgi:hypothetical protein